MNKRSRGARLLHLFTGGSLESVVLRVLEDYEACVGSFQSHSSDWKIKPALSLCLQLSQSNLGRLALPVAMLGASYMDRHCIA